VKLPVIVQGTGAESELTSEAEQHHTAEADIAQPETPSTSHPASEKTESTNPTTPSSIQQHSIPAGGDTTPVAPKKSQRSTVPVVPAIPKAASRESPKPAPENTGEEPRGSATEVEPDAAKAEVAEAEPGATEEVKDPAPKAWTTPKLWTGLFNPAVTTSTAASSESGRAAAAPGFGKTNSESLADALRLFNAISSESKVAFLEPRGLVNTGNMCYMNSVSGFPLLLLRMLTPILGSPSSYFLYSFLQLLGSGQQEGCV